MFNRQILFLFLLGLMLSLASFLLLDQKLAPLALVSADTAFAIWSAITILGDTSWVALLVLTIWAFTYALGNVQPDTLHWPLIRKKAVLVFAAIALPRIAVMILKFGVGRARPYMGDIGSHPFNRSEDFASWPSGHATIAFAFAMAVGLVIPALRWPLFALAVLVGYSRMALGMHYLADVIAGATIGAVGAVLVYRWLAPKLGF